MRNYIILNGQNSNSISGLLIQSLAPISKPLMRTEIEEIDGRDGDITTKLGYSAYDKQITIGLFGNYDVDQVIAFFNSEGTAIFSNEPDKYYNYQIVDQIDFERLVRYKTATVTMHCQPFKYSTTEGADILSSSDNFATLNQSLNTDSSFYTYSSNVQADITATRQSGTGGKFFAVFTVPVVQGVTYHFSGNVSRNVSMYGYTDQLRGSSAGIAGKGFSGNFVYTATFTGTMVLGFYSNATTEIFIRNFAISNEAGTTISDEGTNLVLEGTGEAPFSQFDLKGNTEQSGTPTPDAPVPVKVVTGENTIVIGGGKNLFDGANANAKTGYILNNSGTEVSDNTGGYTRNYSLVNPNTTYTLSGMPPNGTRRIYFYDGSKTFLSRSDGYTGASTITFTTPANCYLVNIQIYTNTDTASVMALWQLELGSTATSFEPYQGQSYEVNLGKNLFDKANANVLNAYIDLTSKILTSNSINWIVWIPASPNTTYTISVMASGWTREMAWTEAEPAAGVQTYGMVSLYNGQTSISLTTGATANFIVVRLWHNNNSSETWQQALDNLQIEKGSTATTYASYFTPIELCKMTSRGVLYQDYLYKSENKWYVHKAVGKQVVDSSTITLRTSYSNVDYGAIPKPTDFKGYNNYTHYDGMYCTHSEIKGDPSGGWDQDSTVGYIYDTPVNVKYWAGFAKGTSLDVIKTTLAGCIIYYPLATPTDTEITNAALIEQLNDIADHAHAYKERTHVSSTYATGNVPHIIAAAVTGDADGTVTNSGNIYSKPKLTIFGTGDIGVYLNGVQMFQIALGTSGYITIDTALMEAYQDNLQTLMNRQVTGDYSNFVLNPGENTISFTGSVSMCVVENYSRWL